MRREHPVSLGPEHRDRAWIDKRGAAWVFSFGWHTKINGVLHHVPMVDLDERGVTASYGPFRQAAQ